MVDQSPSTAASSASTAQMAPVAVKRWTPRALRRSIMGLSRTAARAMQPDQAGGIGRAEVAFISSIDSSAVTFWMRISEISDW